MVANGTAPWEGSDVYVRIFKCHLMSLSVGDFLIFDDKGRHVTASCDARDHGKKAHSCYMEGASSVSLLFRKTAETSPLAFWNNVETCIILPLLGPMHVTALVISDMM